jgi:hypothetical protein
MRTSLREEGFLARYKAAAVSQDVANHKATRDQLKWQQQQKSSGPQNPQKRYFIESPSDKALEEAFGEAQKSFEGIRRSLHRAHQT